MYTSIWWARRVSHSVDFEVNQDELQGVCGADSSDARVTRVLKRFMRALTGITPSRNPDSFLVLPMAIVSAPL
jgi:hypothetical protein